MMKLALVFVAALALGVDGQKNDYLYLCMDHTMGKPSVGPACNPLISSGVSGVERDTILDLHNALRRRVAFGNETLGAPGPQPKAANMRMLVWNKELAIIAQRWSDQCIFAHDTCRKVLTFSPVGQNVYQSMSTTKEKKANWNETLNNWYKQAALFDKMSINSYVFSGTTAHYTQIVWANTSAVGCGFSMYQRINSTYINQFYVCNYGPGGNTFGNTVYINGTACSRCPSGTVCSKGLCQ